MNLFSAIKWHLQLKQVKHGKHVSTVCLTVKMNLLGTGRVGEGT